MMNRFLYLKRMLRTVLFVLLLSIAGMTKAQTENITFADAVVKAYCVANWDTDGDGELNQAEAVAVTSLDGVFMFDDGITSFDELQFFTGLTSFGEDEFNSCTSLASLTIPQAVISIGNSAFSDCSSLTSMTSYACTPPILGNDVFYNVPSIVVLNVPCHTSAMYQEADGWSDFSNFEEFEYGLCPIPFADATVKAICVAHWDTNSDGELSYAEAAAVTNLGTYFKSTAITSFDELEYFTSLTSLPNTAFYGCTSLASITLPSSISALGNGSFYNCTNLATMTVYAETPPTVGTNAFKNVPTSMVVQVLCEAYDAYHTANGWSEFTNIQGFGLSCPIIFADANVKALCVANWDNDGDGELSYAEAAAVTDLGEVFKDNSTITSFDELQYFTNLNSIGNYAFWYCNNLTSIVIPNSVTFIGDYAFRFCNNLTFANIGNSVTSIGDFAFGHCSGLTSIDIPNSVISIGHQTFAVCSGLTSIEIPNSVVSIGTYAFSGCTGLTSITIPNSVTLIETNPFTQCSSLQQIIVESGNMVYDSRNNCNAIIKTDTNELVAGCRNTVIPNSVTSIDTDAFSGCIGLTSITIPNSVISIENDAFISCSNLTFISIPSSVTFIGFAFRYCSGIEQIVVDSGNTVYDSRGNCNAIIKTGTNELITGCKNTIIPNTVISIGRDAFDGCTGLTSITIPNSVISIGESAFGDCRSLTSIEIPNSVVTIELYAFYYCTSLNTIIIPNSVTFIGSYVFRGCWSLNSLTILAGNPPVLGTNSFSDINKLIPVYVPCGSVEAYTSANWGGFNSFIGLCGGTVTVAANPEEGGMVTGGGLYEAGESCTVMAIANEDYTFFNWMKNGEVVSYEGTYSFRVIENTSMVANFAPGVTIAFADANVKALCVANWDTNSDGELSYAEAAAVTDIGQVFYNNRTIISFDELQYFTGLTSIGNGAFYCCTNLTSIEIPNSVTSIGSNAFLRCTRLTSIEIPNSVTRIESLAFQSCSSLTSIEIPNSVTYIGSNPFLSCGQLEQIIVASDNIYYDSRENCNAIIKTSTNALVTGCKNTMIPNSVSSIGESAFYYCIGLISVEIPSSVTFIGQWAFCGCTSLTSMTVLPDNPPILGNGVFDNLNMEIPVYVPCTSLDAYHNTAGWNTFTNYLSATVCDFGEITVTANPVNGGTVTGEGSYEGGTICTLIATANHGYYFSNWTEDGEVVSYNAEYTFTVAGDRNLVANFRAIPPAPVVAEYYPDSNEPNSPYVRIYWDAVGTMIGDATASSSTNYMPFYTLYNYSISEALYTGTEMSEAGMTAGPITSLSWEAVSVTTNQPQNNISIWMANVPDTELTTSSHLASNMTLVYTGNIGIPPLGWNEFVFNESNFVWDGTSNVLILCQRNNGQWNGSVYWRSHNPGFYGMAYKYQDGTPYDVTSQIYTLYLSNTVRPNIIMKGEGSMTYNLYRANCDGTDAQLIAENLNDTQYIDETWWQLENNSYKYGVSIADSTNTDIFWSNCIEKQGDVVVQTVALSEGWNWLSTYIEREPVELLDMLKESLSENGIQIESQYDGLTENIGDGYWWGDLDGVGIMNENMYLIEVAADCTVEVEGTAVDPADHEITLYPEWTWIGFPYFEEVDIVAAFANFEAEEGDMIEGPDGVAEYLGDGYWWGIETFVPGQGYMYFSNSDESKTLVFQTGRSKAKAKAGFIGGKAPKMSIERKVESWD